MSKVLVTRAKLDALANSIIAKAGSSSSSLTLAEMKTEVDNIPTGGGGGSLDDFLEYAAVPLIETSAAAIRDYACYYYGYTATSGTTKLIANNALSVGTQAFSQAQALGAVELEKAETIGMQAFQGSGIQSVKLGSVKAIINSAFSYCSSLTDLKIPATIEKLEASFQSCNHLARVIFLGAAAGADLSAYAFRYCNALTDVYVPWAEGEVANAPWGAQYATVHYNTTFDANGEPVT